MNEFNIGDRVRIIDNLTAVGTITKVDKFCTIKWDDRGKRPEYGWKESIELVPEDEEVGKLKVGDRVRFIEPQIGDSKEHTVTFADGDYVRLDNDIAGWYHNRFEKVQEVSTPKFKVGDTVIAADGSMKNKPLTVEEVESKHIYSFKNTCFRSSEGNLRKVEKKEKAVFKPKFNIGDRVLAGGYRGTVQAICQNNGRFNKVRYDIGGYNLYNDGELDHLEEVWE